MDFNFSPYDSSNSLTPFLKSSLSFSMKNMRGQVNILDVLTSYLMPIVSFFIKKPSPPISVCLSFNIVMRNQNRSCINKRGTCRSYFFYLRCFPPQAGSSVWMNFLQRSRSLTFSSQSFLCQGFSDAIFRSYKNRNPRKNCSLLPMTGNY